MKNLKNVNALVLMAAMGLVSVNSLAGGFLGDAINVIAPGVGTELDRINHQLGNPVDHAAAVVCDAYAPGCGSALEAGWELQRMNNGSRGRGVGSSMPVGNRCLTQAGVFGPGPINPLGAVCFANTAYGTLQGYVVQ